MNVIPETIDLIVFLKIVAWKLINS